MEILREEVKVAAAHDVESRARSVESRPEADGIVVRSEPELDSALDSVHARRFLDRSLPVGLTIRIPYPLAPLSIAPHALEVTHQFTGPYVRFVRFEDSSAELIVTESGTSTTVELLARDHATAASLWDVIRGRVLAQLHESGTVRCQLWSAGGYRASGNDHKVKSSRWTDVRRNYPRATAEQLDQLMAMETPDHDGGLILWHGLPGTGKTSAVRSLIAEWLPWCDAHIITDPEKFFTSPDYLLDVLGMPPRPDFRQPLRSLDELAPRRWKVIVCEDADEYLRSDARERSGPALGRLLNLTDGLMGEGSRTLVLLTTNDQLGRIHPAVQRPGRCRASIEFPAMSATEAAAWCPPGVKASTTSMTLAELYALTRGQDLPDADPSAGLYL